LFYFVFDFYFYLSEEKKIYLFFFSSEPNLITTFQAKKSLSKQKKLPHLVENSRISLEHKSKSIDSPTFYNTPLMEKKKLDAIKMVFVIINIEFYFILSKSLEIQKIGIIFC